MRRIIFSVITLLGTWGGYAVGQATPSDTQTLQALLTEVRALRQDVRVSLNRAQTMQILLARFQMQEGVVTRASDRLNEARQKLSDARTNQKEMILHVKQLEDALNSTGSAQEQASLQERIKQGKSELEIAADLAQQRQTAQMQSEQQLRDEQDKLGAIEAQLDELIRTMANSNDKSSASRPCKQCPVPKYRKGIRVG